MLNYYGQKSQCLALLYIEELYSCGWFLIFLTITSMAHIKLINFRYLRSDIFISNRIVIHFSSTLYHLKKISILALNCFLRQKNFTSLLVMSILNIGPQFLIAEFLISSLYPPYF